MSRRAAARSPLWRAAGGVLWAWLLPAAPALSQGPATPPATAPTTPGVASAPGTASKPLINDVTPPDPASAGRSVDQDRRCVETLYQLELLLGRHRVFRLDDDGRERTYLADRDRAEEIARLGEIRDGACSNEQPQQGSQKRRAAELFQFLSPACREAREEIERLARPDSRTSRNEMERHRDALRRICPEPPESPPSEGLWLADRVRTARPQ